MKILYLTDGSSFGIPSNFNFGLRPHGTWMQLLNAFHCNYQRIDELINKNEKFDIAILAGIHDNRHDLINNTFISKIRKIANKIGFSQEGGHNTFFIKTPISNQIFYINIIQNVDFIMCHNEVDKKYYENLYNKPCYINKQMIYDLGEPTCEKENKIILPGPSNIYYGNMDSYLIGLDTNLPMYVYKGHTYTSEHEYLENITYLHWESDYIKFNNNLKTFKYCMYLLQNPIGGSFPLQCAMNKVACFSWNTCETATECFPDLVFDYGDYNKIRFMFNKIHNDSKYYSSIVNKARENFIKKYNFEDYTKNTINFLSNL